MTGDPTVPARAASVALRCLELPVVKLSALISPANIQPANAVVLLSCCRQRLRLWRRSADRHAHRPAAAGVCNERPAAGKWSGGSEGGASRDRHKWGRSCGALRMSFQALLSLSHLPVRLADALPSWHWHGRLTGLAAAAAVEQQRLFVAAGRLRLLHSVVLPACTVCCSSCTLSCPVTCQV